MTRDEEDVRAALGRALDGEPPLGLDRERVFAAGRRRLRRRRTAAAGGVAAGVVVLVLGVSTLAGGGLGLSGPDLPPGRSSVTAPPPPATSPVRAAPPGPSLPVNRRPSTPIDPGAAARIVEVLQDTKIAWPDVLVDTPSWVPSQDSRGAAAEATLRTRAGARTVTVTVTSGTRTLECVGSDGGAPLPHCEVRQDPSGAWVRVTIDDPGDPETAVVAQVVAVRADGVVVEVLETSGGGSGGDPALVLDDAALVGLALLPGLGGAR